AIRATPKGRFFPLTRDELLESLALVRSIREGQLDRIEIPEAPLDILTQQLIAEAACRGPDADFTVAQAHALFSGSWPFRNLSLETFRQVVAMAADGYAAGRRRFAYLLWDRLQDRLSARAGARLAALTSGGAIPEMGDYRVVLDEDGTTVGSVNEDFAIESLKGDIFILGTHSWRIQHVRGTEVVVSDAAGQPPTIPFWVGEAPGRTDEFSTAVSRLREEIGEHLPPPSEDDSAWLARDTVEILQQHPTTPFDPARDWLGRVTGVADVWPLLQAVHYVAVQKAALGVVPSKQNIVFERFFDESGGMQLVIHSPYGARINRGWGLALRKRFCRAFDFELQASADDDGIVLSLGAQQSFPVEDLFKMLTAENAEHFLTQALLAAPMFGARWRWNATRALAVLRQMRGKRVAPALLKFRSEDLLTAVFPAQTACQENAPGDIEIPDHPLVAQTVHDCMTEAMDLRGLKKLFTDVEAGTVKLLARDTREPSPFAYQLINAYPYAFLDDAPAEERRTRAVAMRPALSVTELQDLDRMDPKAIGQVCEEAWPEPRSADEWYETLVATPAFPLAQAKGFAAFTESLEAQGRLAVARGKHDGRSYAWLVAAENIPVIEAAFEGVVWETAPTLPDWIRSLTPPTRSEARQNILRAWLEISGPVTPETLSELFALENPVVYLEAVETLGTILRCRMERGTPDYTHWCARGLLRRIHRLTVEGLREQIRPVSAEDYFEFLFELHGLNLAAPAKTRGADGLLQAVELLQGFEAPAGAWEKELLPSRLESYE
ncbi:DEAD/DEAH box helicase, partial [bacterium]|nr:DEAD/DEAH box helicase [bacterium]